jgi:hypothetical protein
MVKAKNARNQIVNDAVTVTVVEDLTTDRFNFRTAAMDGEDYGRGVIDYIDSEISVLADGVAGTTITGTPFATFSVPSNTLLAANYDSEGYLTDMDWFYFDSRLPTCSGEACTFTSDFEGQTYTTRCSMIVYDHHYACTLSGPDGYSVAFDYRAATDPVGPNTIRRYNLIYPHSAPIVDFGAFDASFIEGQTLTIDLDDFVYDNDTDTSTITWSTSMTRNTIVSIDPSTHDATITQATPSWIGSEMVNFIATDPEGNRGSDLLTIRVLQNDNDPPVIVAKDPDSDTANVGRRSSRLFSIDAIDPDYDLLTITWRKGADVVATDTFSYNYVDTDSIPHPLTVIVSDGSDEDSEAWDINIVDPIGTVGGTVTDADTGLPIGAVHVQLFDPGSTILVEETYTTVGGIYTITVDEGTYDIKFSATGYSELTVPNIMIYSGETTIQDAELELTPPPIGTVQGTVRDAATSAVLGGALVEAMIGATVHNTTSTNPSGTYSMMLSEGTYTLRFSKLGYQTTDTPGVVITTGGTTTVNANLDETVITDGTIAGTVTQEGTGVALSGVLVEVIDGVTIVDSMTTTAGGTYSMTVTADTYDVRFSKAGYKTQTVTGVAVPAGVTTTFNYDMITWWDDSFSHKRQITISNPDGIDLTGQAVPIILNSANIDLSMELNDLRFVNSAEDTELSYTFKNLNTSADSVVAVNLGNPATPTDDVLIWMYYGSAVSSHADFPTTFGTDVYTFLTFDDGSMDDISGNLRDAIDSLGTTHYFTSSLSPIATGGRGRDDAGLMSIPAEIGMAQLTYALWFRINTTYSETMTSDPTRTLNLAQYCENDACPRTDKILILFADGTDKGKLDFFTYPGSDNHLFSTTTTWNANQWYCVVASVGPSGKQLWIDGELEASDALSGSWTSGHNFVLSKSVSPSVGIDIGEFRVYTSGAKTPDEIKNFCSPPTSLVGPEI